MIVSLNSRIGAATCAIKKGSVKLTDPFSDRLDSLMGASNKLPFLWKMALQSGLLGNGSSRFWAFYLRLGLFLEKRFFPSPHRPVQKRPYMLLRFSGAVRSGLRW